jgi:uncharacterized repeat protein (TIGR03803 family)
MRRKPFSTVLMAMLLFGSVILAGAPCGWASTVTVLYNFKDRRDGYSPSGVIMVNGKLYGTTATGGTYESGTVFELVQTKSGWVKKTLHEFTGGADGLDPTSGLVADKAGNLYGTAGGGVVFELTRGSRGGWHFRVIYTFNGTGGADPIGLFFDAGSLYGTTAAGGGTGCAYGHGCGTVYELSPGRNGKWGLATLHDFKGTDGANPEAPLYRNAEGNLYGTTEGGRGCPGSFGCGTVFELSPSGGGWKFSVLHRFGGGADGCNPLGPLVMDREGALYGTATDCGEGEGPRVSVDSARRGMAEECALPVRAAPGRCIASRRRAIWLGQHYVRDWLRGRDILRRCDIQAGPFGRGLEGIGTFQL